MKEQIIVFSIISFLILGSFGVIGLKTINSVLTDDPPTLTITVDYVEQIDPIEGFGHTPAPE